MLFLRMDAGNNLLTNGGLEDINGTWQNTVNFRMQLPVGSTQLTGWQVVGPGTHGPLTRPIAVAWSKEPGAEIDPKAESFSSIWRTDRRMFHLEASSNLSVLWRVPTTVELERGHEPADKKPGIGHGYN